MPRHVRQHEAVAFRDRLHPIAERLEIRLHLGRGILRVVLEPLVPRVAHLALADAVEEVHDLAARRVGRQDRRGVRIFRGEIEPADVHLDEQLLPQAGAVEHERLAADGGVIFHVDARERQRERRNGDRERQQSRDF